MNFNLFSYVAIGLGVISGIHETKLKEANCSLVAAIDPNKATHSKVSSQVPVFVSFEEFVKTQEIPSHFWDVRTPTDSHFSVVRQISQVYPAANILIEKPICLSKEVKAFKSFLKEHQGKISVNENYLHSSTTKKVKEYVERFLAEIREVKIEMSKNRLEDYKNGRYQEKKGAFMYEGSHMLSALKQLDSSFLPVAANLKNKLSVLFTDAVVGDTTLPFQGSAKINYETESGIKVEIYSSMEGKIKNGYFFENLEKGLTEEIANQEIEDTSRRHRIIIIQGVDSHSVSTTILGFYDPFTVHKSYPVSGAIFAIKNNQIVEKNFPIPDDTMKSSLGTIVEYFKGNKEANPGSPEEAIQIVEIMDFLTEAIKI
jgi:predicted dehydrogenase